ncbi:MAG: type VI secretion system contractile sheath protein TssC [Bacteroidota bacterium]
MAKEHDSLVPKEKQYKEVEQSTASEQLSLEDSLAALMKFGGFDIVSTTVEKGENLDPRKKARKNILLTEKKNKKERGLLKKRLELWIDLLENGENIPDMVSKCEAKSKSATDLLAQNIGKALDATEALERSYRAVDLFLKNTGQAEVRNVNFLNASKEHKTELDNNHFANSVQNELNHNFNRLDLRRAYSLMLIPGYLGENSVINHWAEMAHNHKVTLITDFRHLDAPEDVIDLFMDADHASADAFKANLVMASNWLVGREGYPEYGIEDAMYVPPSAALAGRIYESQGGMAQVVAGNKHGKMRGIDGVAFDIKKTEITQLENLGLVPMVNEFGSVMAFSGKTLFNGDNVGLQSYSVVRVFDWVTKVLIDFLNRRAFENYNMKTQKEIEKQVSKFLEGIKGNGKLIKDFSIKRLEQDSQNPDIVHVDIHIQPFFATRSFLLAMSGTKGDDGTEWKTGID